jgi:hypothetical protein
MEDVQLLHLFWTLNIKILLLNLNINIDKLLKFKKIQKGAKVELRFEFFTWVELYLEN